MQFNFNANNVPPAAALDPLPTDWYTCTVTSSELKETANKQGTFLNLELTVAEGPHKGRKVYSRHNVSNPNPVAAEIGAKAISALCHAVGVLQIQDTTQLHGRPFCARVVLKPAEDGYDASNDVKGYKAADNGVGNAAQYAPPAQQAPAYAPPPAQAAPAQAAPAPWQQAAPQAPAAQPQAPAPAPWQQAPQQVQPPQQAPAPQQAPPPPPPGYGQPPQGYAQPPQQAAPWQQQAPAQQPPQAPQGAPWAQPQNYGQAPQQPQGAPPPWAQQ